MADINDFLDQTSPEEAAAGSPTRGIAGPPPPPDSEVVGWLSGQNEKTRLNLAVKDGFQRDSQKSSRILKLQAKTGLPEDLIERNLDDIEKKAQEADFDPDKFYAQSPIVAQWMSENPNHAAVAKEDVSKLSYLERQMKHISQQFDIGNQTTELSDIGEKAFLGTITPADRRRQFEIEGQIGQAQDYGIEGFFEGIPGAIANQLPIFGNTISGQVKGTVVGALGGAGTALVAGQLGPQVALPEELLTVPAGAIAGGTIGWRYGAAVEAARMEASLAYLDFEKIKDEQGIPMGRGAALGAATIVGAINGGLETVGLSTITKSIPGLRNLTRGGMKTILKNPTVRRAFTQYAKNVGTAMAGEGITEFLQEIVKITGQEILEMKSEGTLQNASSVDIISRIFSQENLDAAVQSGVQGAQAGGGITAATSSVSVATDVRRAQKARAMEQAFKQVGEGAKDLQMLKNLPEQSQEVVKRIAQSGPVDTVYAPVDTWQEYWQSKGLDPVQAAQEVLGQDIESYNEAVQTGGDIAIPMEKYATTIAPSEHHEFFQSEIKSDPLDMNAREANEFIARMDEFEAQQAEQQQQAIEQNEQEQIQEQVVNQLQESGVDEATAQTQAQLLSKGFGSLAERAGVSPQELFSRYGLQISRPELQGELAVGEQAFNQEQAVKLNQETARVAAAENIGFDTRRVLLHGTNAEFDEFQVSNDGLSGKGVYFFSDPNNANPENYGDRVLEVYAKKGKLLDLTDKSIDNMLKVFDEIGISKEGYLKRRNELIEGSRKRAEQSLQRARDVRAKKGKSPLTPEQESAFIRDYEPLDNSTFLFEIQREIHRQNPELEWNEAGEQAYKKLEDAGYIGVENYLNGQPVVAIWDPKNIRSTDAAFDPGKVDSANIFAQDERGRIRFNDQRQFKIELLKNADLSTFLHETGHFYLEVLGDLATQDGVNPEIAKDYQTVLSWMGVENREQISVEQHEKWARGFEAYLMEGKAPSIELRNAFAKFRAWLSSIYKKMKNLNVELTDDVRGVMDRMLATNQELEAARQQQNLSPLFADLTQSGMNEQQAQEYSDAIMDAQDSALQEMTRKHVEQIQREKKKWWREESAKVRSEVSNDIDQEKVYIALANLQRGTLPDGSPLPDGVKPVKLDRQALVRDYDPNFIKERLPRPFVYAREGGIHHDIAADLFGFENGDALLTQLANAVPRKQEIENRVNKIMKERHGDLLNDGTAQAEAMKVIHNDKTAQLMRKELEYLASDNFAKFKGLVRKINRPVPKIDFVRSQAESIIAKKRVRDVKPVVYQRAEAKAAREAQELFLKGDFTNAFEAKQKQLFNHELYRAATEARENVDKIVNYMSKFQKKSTRERLGKAGGTYLDQIDAILERFSFKKGLSLKSLDKQQSLLAWMNEQQELGFTVDLPEKLLNEAVRQHYMETSVEELNGVKDSVQSIEHLARTKNKLLANKKARDLQAAEDEIVASIAAHHKIKSDPPDFAPGMKARLAEKARGVLAAHTKMEFLFELLDGNKEFGAAWSYLFKPFVDAENTESNMMKDVTKNMRDIFGAYTKKERALWYYKKEFIPEIGTSMNKANILTVALNWGNEYNRAALMEGYQWTEGQVQAILSKLDQRDWQAVQKVWDYIDTFWPQVQQQEKELNGIAPPKVEASEIVNDYGTFKGGYYPIIFDSKLSWRQSKLEEAASVKEMFGGNWAKAMTKHGHTKERTNTGGKPIKLELSGLTEHVSSVVHDLAYRKAIVDVSRIVNRKGVREAIESSVGREMYRQINPWLTAIAGDRRSEPNNPLEGILSRARMGATVVNMGWKFTTAIVQFTGYSVSTKELGGKYAFQGLKQTLQNPLKIKESYRFMSDRSAFMRDRLGNYDRDIRDSLKKLNVAGVKPGIFSVADAYTNELRDSYFAMIGYMDLAVSMPTWFGAYSKAMDGNVENIQKGNEQDAIAYADSMVRKTQGAGASKDLALVQRGNEAFKLFTMFYSYFSVLFNQFQKTTNQFRFDKNIPKLVGSMFLLWFFPAVIEDIILGRGPDDDADEEEWTKWFIKKEVTYPFQGIVLMRDVVNGMDQYGYSPSAAFDAFESLARTGKTGVNLLTGEKDDIERRDIKSVFMTTGYLTGLPTRQIWLSSEYLHDWMTGEESPETPVEGVWRTLVTGKPKE